MKIVLMIIIVWFVFSFFLKMLLKINNQNKYKKNKDNHKFEKKLDIIDGEYEEIE